MLDSGWGHSEFIRWLLVLEVVGFALFPLTSTVFPGLADRGYALSKAIGLLVLTYVYWLVLTIGLLPNGQLTLFALLFGLAITAAVVAHRQRQALRSLFQRRWKLLLATELIFLISFLGATFLRSFVPEIQDRHEGRMNLLFIQGVLRADSFPPEDPWLAGFDVNYYYFGHTMCAALIQMSGVGAAYGYNLALATFFALTATAAFGLAANFAIAAGRQRLALVGGLVCAVLVLLVGNWEAVFELLAIHELAPEWFIDAANIHGLDAAGSSSSWYPTEDLAWRRAAKFAGENSIRYFPGFPFVMGELHAHVMAFPYLLGAMAAATSLLAYSRVSHDSSPASYRPDEVELANGSASSSVGGSLTWRTWARAPLSLLVTGLLLGCPLVIQSWNFPIAPALLAFAALLVNRTKTNSLKQAATDAISFVAPVSVLGILLFLPFLISLDSSAVGGLEPVRATGAIGSRPDSVTIPEHLIIGWGPLLLVAAVLAGLQIWQTPSLSRVDCVAAALPLVLLSAWCFAVILDTSWATFSEELLERGTGWITWAVLAVLVSATASAALRSAGDVYRPWRALAFGIIAVGLMTILFLEHFFLEEWAQDRRNTVFKLSLVAWILIAAGAALAAIDLFYEVRQSIGRARSAAARQIPQVAVIVAVVAVGLGLVYPLIATANRTHGLTGEQTLDGFHGLAREDRALINWFEDRDGETIVHVSPPGIVPWTTGTPAFLGSPHRQRVWRGNIPEINERGRIMRLIYQQGRPDEILAALEADDVRYVVVGRGEEQAYGEQVRTRFDGLLEVEARFGTTVIYDTDGAVGSAR